MDARGISHPDVQVALHRDEAAGRYLFGVIIEGEFVPLVERKLGRIDKWARIGKQRRAEQQPQQPAQAPAQQPQQ